MNKYEEIMLKRYGERYAKYRETYKSNDIKENLPFPLQIDLDLLDACPLKCPTCHSIGRKRNTKPISRELLAQIICECNENDLCAINIGGCGEPLLNKGLTFETLNELKNTSVMDVFLHTSGLLMDKACAQDLIDLGVTHLCISVDATTQETFEKMRGAKLSKLIDNIENFLALRKNELPVLRVSFLATSVNIHEKEKFIEFWKDKAHTVDIQNYHKSYDIQPNVQVTKQEKAGYSDKLPMSSPKSKRMAIVAPEYLCTSCGGTEVQFSIENDDTFKKHKTIKNYWDSLLLR